MQRSEAGVALRVDASTVSGPVNRVSYAPVELCVHVVDVVSTVYDLLDIAPPEVLKGYPQHPIEGESFAAALTDPKAPAKSTQFYAMLGQRWIYHEGWLACTMHPPLSGWGNFDRDEWEPHNLAADRSESVNVASKQLVRLEALKDLWFYHAGTMNGLPLDDRTALGATLAERPRAAAPRKQRVFYPNCPDVPESAGPMIFGRSYKIAAGVRIDTTDAQGVLSTRHVSLLRTGRQLHPFAVWNFS